MAIALGSVPGYESAKLNLLLPVAANLRALGYEVTQLLERRTGKNPCQNVTDPVIVYQSSELFN